MTGGDFRVADGNGAKRPVVAFDDLAVEIPVAPEDADGPDDADDSTTG